MAHSLNRLTDSTLRKSTFYTVGNTKLFDGGGLYLHVQKAGQYWRMKYRIHGKERLLSIGKYPQVTLSQARAERDEARRLVSQGIDPVQQRRQQEQQRRAEVDNSLMGVSLEWLEHVHKPGVAANTARRNEQRLHRHVFPALGRTPIADIEPPAILNLLQSLADRPETASRIKVLLSMVFRYGVGAGYVSRDPTQDLKGLTPTPKRNHFAAQVKPDDLVPVLTAMDGYQGAPETTVALQLLPLVLLRPYDLRNLQWDQVDVSARQIELPATKNGDPLVVPLSDQALALLERIEPLSRHRSRYVFPGARSAARPMSENTLGAALRNLGFSGKQTAHGFRATARTMLVERLGYPVELVEMQLAHSVRDVHGRAYNRTQWFDERTRMMQQWADYLDQLKAGGGNVVSIGAASG
ncbi:tyrosine-type recombinase/integrase [Vreelandella utahensis]|uniref:tyrosine-type recombinase/integrase n=1 Tax=Vreelandella halophila TaxID=86177 RepID=UPI0009862829|nr:integrase arm-type DNA-binding domain-containing protein [Halomonas utahensis]